jgi:hypothetical protein
VSLSVNASRPAGTESTSPALRLAPSACARAVVAGVRACAHGERWLFSPAQHVHILGTSSRVGANAAANGIFERWSIRRGSSSAAMHIAMPVSPSLAQVR